jgi:peptidoglycan hydrolase-like protein with peptidoglycan-binding domain
MMKAILISSGGGVPWLAAAVAGSVLAFGSVHAHDTSLPDSPSGQLYLSPSQVRLVQEKLRDQGRSVTVDGVWGAQTARQVREFQRANDLAATGQLDTSLLSALDIGDVLEGETTSNFLDGLLRTERSAAAGAGRGAPLFVSPVHVAQVQHLLKAAGFYNGAIDGSWGPATARAADKFRSEHGLEANAGLDIALLRAMNRERAAVPKLPEAAMLRTAGVPLHAGTEAIRALQRELSKKGHEAGGVDGVWGENTRQALREFQRQHDLETTGTLTLPTLAALGIDIASEPGKKALSAQDE